MSSLVVATSTKDILHSPAATTKSKIQRSETAETAPTNSRPNSFGPDADSFDNDERLVLMARAEELFQHEKILEAYRLLHAVRDKSLFLEKHNDICRIAKECELAICDLLVDPEEEADNGGEAKNNTKNEKRAWIKQGETHGQRRQTVIYYKVDEQVRLTCRLETPIEQDLLVPLLSVLNESELYQDWCPSWTLPRMGIKESKQLSSFGRVNQILKVVADVPWPFSSREAIVQTDVVDEIDCNGYFAVRLHTLMEEGEHDIIVVPPKDPNTERVDFEGTLMFRPCLGDSTSSSHIRDDMPMVLVSAKFCIDPKLAGIPSSAINFITRTVIGDVWGMLLQVAEQVRDGKRRHHDEAIASKPEFYKYVEERIAAMFEKQAMETIDIKGYQNFIAYLQT